MKKQITTSINSFKNFNKAPEKNKTQQIVQLRGQTSTIWNLKWVNEASIEI
jgi:hypothetical protein